MIGGDVRKRAQELTRKITSNPFFPLLFVGEAVKNSAFHVVADQPPMDVVGASVVMALLSIVGWLYSADDVAWGLSKAVEAVEDTTDNDADSQESESSSPESDGSAGEEDT